jgi:hypothetical protein
MKTAILILAAAAGIASAQDYSSIPECAAPCLQEATSEAGCALDDSACQCKPDFLVALQPIIMPCLLKACSAEEITQSIQAANDICAAVTGSSAAKTTMTTVTAPTGVVGSSGNDTATLTTSTPVATTTGDPTTTPDDPNAGVVVGPAAVGMVGVVVAAGMALL